MADRSAFGECLPDVNPTYANVPEANSTENSMAAPRLMRPSSTVRLLAIVAHADEATSLADHKNHPDPSARGRLVLGVAGVVVITIAAIRREQLA